MPAKSIEIHSDYSVLDYWSMGLRRWPWIVAPIVLLVFLSALYSQTRPAAYEATTRVLLAETASQRVFDPGSQSAGVLTRELANEISLATSDAVERLVLSETGTLPTISVTADAEADVLVFTAVAGTPELAAGAANTWAEKYVEVKRQEAIENIESTVSSLEDRLLELASKRQTIRAPLDELNEQILAARSEQAASKLQGDYDRMADELSYEIELVTAQATATTTRLTELELQAQLAAAGVARVVQIADPPLESKNPSLVRALTPALLLGVLVGVALAFLAELRDNTIKSAADVLAVTGLPVLASVPKVGRSDRGELGLVAQREPDSLVADSFHKLRSSIDFAAVDAPVRSVLITSPNPGEGKSTTASNLALVFGSVGQQTVLVDADYRRPRVHEIFQIPQTPGLSDSVLHGVDLARSARSVRAPGIDSLVVIPSGTVPPRPASFIGTRGYLGSLEWIENQADIMIIDAPPVLLASEPQTLAKHVDLVVLTVVVGKTTKANLREVHTVLGQAGANILGVVLIAVEDLESHGRYGYSRSERVGGQRSARMGPGLFGPRQGTGTIDLDHLSSAGAPASDDRFVRVQAHQ